MVNYDEMRAARVKARLTQKQMAEFIGVSENTYNSKESGKSPIDVSEAVLFCSAVGITDPAEKALIFLA